MGLSPREVDALSPWEFNAIARGFARSKGVDGKNGAADVSDDELRRMGIKGF